MQLDLSSNELEYLRRLLTSTLSELRGEIAATDTRDFKESLERDERVLRSIMERIDAPLPPKPTAKPAEVKPAAVAAAKPAAKPLSRLEMLRQQKNEPAGNNK